MNTRLLETFLWVAQLRSFKGAAARLNLTQAAVSGRIAALESDLGNQLFERAGRDVQLTPAGCALLHHAQRLLDADRAMRQALQQPQPLRGTVRVGIVESIVHTWFRPFVAALQHTYPDIEIELTTESTRRLQDLLKRGRVDAILQTDPVVGEDIRNRDLGTLAMCWICAADAAIPSHAPLADLLAWPMVTFPRYSQPHMQLLEVIDRAGLRPGRLHFVSSIAASMQLVETGMGLGVLPIAAVQAGLDAGRYRRVTCEYELPDLHLVASWRPDPVAGLAEAVVGLAQEQMRRYAREVTTATAPRECAALLP